MCRCNDDMTLNEAIKLIQDGVKQINYYRYKNEFKPKNGFDPSDKGLDDKVYVEKFEYDSPKTDRSFFVSFGQPYNVTWSMDGIIFEQENSIGNHPSMPLEFVNKLGEKGWELVSYENQIFKRKKV